MMTRLALGSFRGPHSFLRVHRHSAASPDASSPNHGIASRGLRTPRPPHRRADVAVAEQLLDGADVVAILQEVGRHCAIPARYPAAFPRTIAMLAVCPCRKFFSPTGPNSPAQKNPAVGTVALRDACSVAMSRLGWPK